MPDSSAPTPPNRIPLALALKYEAGAAPRVVAKGRGTMADRIIGTARENGITIEEDPILAEALASVDLDAEIPIELYQAVAEVISFVLHARSRLPGGR